MDALDLLRHETKKAYAWLETNVGDISHEQANWRPAGTANSIAATYAHTVISADVDLNRHFHGRESIIAGDWGARVGLGETFPDDWISSGDIRWEQLHQYGREVQRCVEQLVDSLTMADLERRFQMVPTSLSVWKGIDVYTLHGWGHVKMHGGEIACLKGLQGGQGYRNFSMLYP